MCYHTSFTGTANDLKEVFLRPFPLENQLRTYFHANGFTHPKLPVVTSLEIKLLQWGLIPNWKNKTLTEMMKQAKKTLNAWDNTIFEFPSYRGPIKSMRCVVPVSAFFEPHIYNGVKYPFLIAHKNGKLLNLAGIYSYWQEPVTGEWLGTFSIITTDQNRVFKKIQNESDRMPVILEDRNVSIWLERDLTEEGIIQLMQPYAEDNLKAYSISKDLFSPTIDSNRPDITEYVQYPELAYDPELSRGFRSQMI